MQDTHTNDHLHTAAISLCLEAFHALLFKCFQDWFATKYSKTRLVSDDFPLRDDAGQVIPPKKGSLGLGANRYRTNVESYFSGIIIPEAYILTSCGLIEKNTPGINSVGNSLENICVQLELQNSSDQNTLLLLTFQLVNEENDGKWENLRFSASQAITCQTVSIQTGNSGEVHVLL